MRSIYIIYLLFIFSTLLPANSEMNLSLELNTTMTLEEKESFLSQLEYGRMLYKNPRGISCSKCHGIEGKGGHKIAKYYDKHKNIKLLKSIDITHYSLEELTASLNNQYKKDGRRKRHKIMPMYYLTRNETLAIFTYLQENK